MADAKESLRDVGPYLVGDVVASLADAVILTDEDDRVFTANQAAQQLLRLGESQMVGRVVTDLFASTPRLAEVVQSTRRMGHHQSSGAEILRTSKGDIPIRISCSPVRGAGGAVTGAALVIQDMSYQRKLEDEVKRNETLARLGGLVAGLAHEIKNPLGGIRGAAQLLQRRVADDEEGRSYTDVIVREVDRLSGLVEELLTFGSPRRPETRQLNIHRTIHEVLEIMRPELEKRDVRVRLEIDPSLPEVRADPAQLTQVLLNLIKNAMEVSSPGATLTLQTRLDMDFRIVRRGEDAAAVSASNRHFVRVAVGDEGPGFPEDLIDRVFEPFVTTKARGTGLGLSICERIIAAHGGDIRAENRQAGGALVTVSLPMAV